MHERGCSPAEIAEAASTGLAPWDWEYLDKDWIESELDGVEEENSDSLEQCEPFQSRDGFPFNFLAQTAIFEDLVDCAERHFENTGRYLQIWGELGELYAEIRFGLRRHGSRKAGSDGTIDGVLVEVKTISPEKTNDWVRIKSAGDFEKVLFIDVDRDFRFRGKLIDRSKLKKVSAKFLRGRFRDGADVI
jgi:hypothetical protein